MTNSMASFYGIVLGHTIAVPGDVRCGSFPEDSTIQRQILLVFL